MTVVTGYQYRLQELSTRSQPVSVGVNAIFIVTISYANILLTKRYKTTPFTLPHQDEEGDKAIAVESFECGIRGVPAQLVRHAIDH